MASSYATQKSDFVSGHSGSSIARVNLVCLTAASSYALWLSLPSALKRPEALSSLLIEMIVLGLPLLAVLTLASHRSVTVNLVCLSLATALSFFQQPSVNPAENGQAKDKLARRSSRSQRAKSKISSSNSHLEQLSASSSQQSAGGESRKGADVGKPRFSRSFVTVYRAHMMIMTVLCILAVDFHVFPREFAKCEVWGTSIMDLGVGSFVFSLGLVQSLPILREEPRKRWPARCLSALTHSLSVLALGLVRLLLVKGTQYPGEHVTEYGVHWNFFITLALLPLAGAVARSFWPRISYFTLALVVASTHQALLSYGGLQQWTLTAPRTNVLSANKEGFTSLPGYIAIFLFGVDAGLYILPPRPDWAYLKPAVRARPITGPMTTLSSMIFQSAMWWMLVPLVNRIFAIPSSRVLANVTYIVWVCAFNVSFLTLYYGAQMLLVSDLDQASQARLVPQTFAAINKNGMLVFLAANLLTGAVNLSINTLTASKERAAGVLLLYAAVVFAAAWLLRHTRLRL